MHHLEVPHHLAGVGPHADEAVGVEVVAGAVPAVHVVAGGAGGQVDEAELLVGAHHRPDVAHARVLPRVVEPGLDPRLAGPGNRVPSPPQLAGPDVVGADVAGAVLHGQGVVGHGLPDDDHVADDEGRRGEVEVDQLVGVLEDAEVDHAGVAEVGNQAARVHVGRQQVRRPHRQDAAARPGVVLPVADPAVGGAPRGLVVGEERQLLHPAGLAGRGVERLDDADAVRGVEHAVDHERRRPQVVRVAQVVPARVQARVDGGAAPDDAEVADRVRVDLVERRVTGEPAVAAVDAPLAVGAVLGRRGPRHGQQGQQGRSRRNAAGRSRRRLVRHRFPVSCLTLSPHRAPAPARQRLPAQPGRLESPQVRRADSRTRNRRRQLRFAARPALPADCTVPRRAGRYRMAENSVGTSIRASIVSTSARSSERSAAMMMRWNSGFSPSLAHISSRASSVGYPSM